MDNDQTGQRPIDELNQLSANVDSVHELSELKPIFSRVEEIAKQNAGATDIELAVKQVKTQLVNHGKKLKEAGAIGTVTSHSRGSLETQSSPNVSSLFSRHEAETGPMIPIPTLPSGENPARISDQRPAYPPPPPPPPPKPSKQRPAAGVFAVPSVPVAPPSAPPGGLNWKRAMAIGAVIGVIGAIGILVAIVTVARKRNLTQPNPSTTLASININTVPPGARIQINGEEKCTSPCKLQLPPGDYRVQAQLEGYDPTLSPHSLVAGQPPVDVVMTLTSQAQSLRILSDIAGKVQLDGKPQGDIAEGSFIMDRVPAGIHTVSITGIGADASFAFEVTPGKAPEIKGTTAAHNLLAVVVSNAGKVARMQSSVGPLKTLLDGKEQPALTTAGTDFPNVPHGDHELIVGEGKDQKKIQVSFLPTPTLTAYLRSDVNAGTLVVVTTPPEDDVMVFVNGKALRKTSRGTLRHQLPPGNITVRVYKDGFEPVGDQAAVVKKGEDTRVEFRLKSQPRSAILKITTATSGATILLDGREIGKVNAEGFFQTGGITPGDHLIEFRMAGYLNRTLTRTFKAGETVEVANEALAKDLAIISLTLNPPETKVNYRHESEAERPLAGGNLISNLQPGRYFITGKAPGYKDKTVPITVSGGQTSIVDLTLEKVTSVPVPPTVRNGSIRDFIPAWTADGDQFTHSSTPSAFGVVPAVGTFKFKVQLVKGGTFSKKIRWAIGYLDGRTHTAFELEKGKFRHISWNNGKQTKGPAMDASGAETYDVKIEVTAGRITTWINGVIVDQVVDPPNVTNGKFVYIMEGKDELAVSGFSFTGSK